MRVLPRTVSGCSTLLVRMAIARPTSALGRIHSVLECCADAILAGEAMALPLCLPGRNA
jgi:hypothetical protein